MAMIPRQINVTSRLFALCAATGLAFSVHLLWVYFTQPDRGMDPIAVWIIPASVVFYAVAAVWAHKTQGARKATRPKGTAPTDGRVSRTRSKRNQRR